MINWKIGCAVMVGAAALVPLSGCGSDNSNLPTPIFTGGTTGQTTAGATTATTSGATTSGATTGTTAGATTGTTAGATTGTTAGATTGTTAGATTGSTGSGLGGVGLTNPTATFTIRQGTFTAGTSAAPGLGGTSTSVAHGGMATLSVTSPVPVSHVFLTTTAAPGFYGDLAFSSPATNPSVGLTVASNTPPGTYQLQVFTVDANGLISRGAPLTVTVT